MTASHCSFGSVFTAPVSLSFFTRSPSRRMPALLTTPLSPPIAPCAQPTKRRDVALARDVEAPRVELSLEGLRALDRLRQADLVDVADGDLRARFGQAMRKVTAHALGSTRHDDLQVFLLQTRDSTELAAS